MLRSWSNKFLLSFSTLTLIICCNTNVFSQEDTSKIQEISSVTYKMTLRSEPVYSEFDSYVMDIEYARGSFYILMREMIDHHLVWLDEYLNPLDTISFDFHPLDLLEDCQHNVILLSRDSMYTIGTPYSRLEIIDREPISRYYNFYKDCMGSVRSNFYMKQLLDYGSSVYYYNVEPYTDSKKCFYSIVDSSMTKSDREELARLGIIGSEDALQAGEIDPMRLQALRANWDAGNFFMNIKKHGSYHPLFVYLDTIFVFDHQRNVKVKLNSDCRVDELCFLDDTLCSKWNDKIIMDEFTGDFYAINVKNGVCTLMRIGKDGEVEHEIIVDGHPYPRNILIFNHSLFFTDKVNYDDNLNKLFRQHL